MSYLLKKVISSSAIGLLLVVSATTDALAIPIDQYASSVIGFSSEGTASPGGWSAAQLLGAPNVATYGDNPNAWSPLTNSGTNEFFSVGYAAAVYATGATIRESFSFYGGFVTQVDAIDTLGVLHTVWTGVDTSAAGVLTNFAVSWVQTGYLVQGLKVYVNNQVASWKEVDSVMLSGQAASVVAVPNPATLALLGLGIIGFGAARRRIV